MITDRMGRKEGTIPEHYYIGDCIKKTKDGYVLCKCSEADDFVVAVVAGEVYLSQDVEDHD